MSSRTLYQHDGLDPGRGGMISGRSFAGFCLAVLSAALTERIGARADHRWTGQAPASCRIRPA